MANLNADAALMTAIFWIGVIFLMIAYDLLKILWKKWRSLEHENMVNTRNAINAQCRDMVKTLKDTDRG